jgi:hypothetical protein
MGLHICWGRPAGFVVVNIISLLLLWNNCPVRAAPAAKAVKRVENENDADKCGIYFAQSTIPGAGYGYVSSTSSTISSYETKPNQTRKRHLIFVPIFLWFACLIYSLFAGKSFNKNEYVTPGDLAVPIIELEWNNGNVKRIENLWTDYHWSART